MKYFGTDGIRGIADEFLSVELATRLGRSLALLPYKKLIIGMDTRDSSNRLAQGVLAGAIDVGIDTAILGVVPTPLLAYASQQYHCLGVMITASHNPYQDNGLKVFQNGKKLFLDDEATLEKGLNEPNLIVATNQKGSLFHAHEVIDSYFNLYKGLLQPSTKPIAFDFANGATSILGPQFFATYFSNIHLVGTSPDGFNINRGVGSTHLEAIKDVVLTHHCQYGFAFDGDGDRVLMVDEGGNEVNGDQMIYIIAKYLKAQNQLLHNTVVLTKMSNLGVIQALEEDGIHVIQTDVGDKYVVDAMDQQNYQLGGENSGHIINRQLINTGDGMLNAAYLLMILQTTNQTIESLSKAITWYPDKLVNLRGMDRNLVKHPEIQALVSSIEQELGKYGKILVRASGTEPLIRISCSARTNELVEHYIDVVKQKLQSIG